MNPKTPSEWFLNALDNMTEKTINEANELSKEYDYILWLDDFKSKNRGMMKENLIKWK